MMPEKTEERFAPPDVNTYYKGVCCNKKCCLDLSPINQRAGIGKTEADDQFVDTWQRTEVSLRINGGSGESEPFDKRSWDTWLFTKESIKVVFTYSIQENKLQVNRRPKREKAKLYIF